MIIDQGKIEELSTRFDLNLGLENRPLLLSADRHIEIVRRVREMLRACLRDQEKQNEILKPGGEWRDYLCERAPLYSTILNGSDEEACNVLAEFWRNGLSPIVKEYAKYGDLLASNTEAKSRFIANIARNYLVWSTIVGGSITDLQVPQIGNPWGVSLGGQLIVPKATRYHTHAWQINNILSDVAKPVVLEIGAGYGGMSYYLRGLRPDICYIDLDLPETLVLAAYYHLASYPDSRVLLYGEGQLADVVSFNAAFLPNYCLPQIESDSVDLAFNSFSLSEIPWTTLEIYIKNIERITRGYFLHNNMDREGVINRGFERVPASKYPLDNSCFKLLYKHFDLFHGQAGDYREFLFQKINSLHR